MYIHIWIYQQLTLKTNYIRKWPWAETSAIFTDNPLISFRCNRNIFLLSCSLLHMFQFRYSAQFYMHLLQHHLLHFLQTLQTLHWWDGPTSIWQICWSPLFCKEQWCWQACCMTFFDVANHFISDLKVCVLSPISGGNDSRKRHEKCLIFKIRTIHPHGFNELFSFIWSYPFIVTVFV